MAEQLAQLVTEFKERGQALALLRRPALSEQDRANLAKNRFAEGASSNLAAHTAKLLADQEASYAQIEPLANAAREKAAIVVAAAAAKQAQDTFGQLSDEELTAAQNSAREAFNVQREQLRLLNTEAARRRHTKRLTDKVSKLSLREREELLQHLSAMKLNPTTKVNTPGS